MKKILNIQAFENLGKNSPVKIFLNLAFIKNIKSYYLIVFLLSPLFVCNIYPQWKPQNIKVGIGYTRAMYFSDSLTGLAAGNDLYRTTDGGLSWKYVRKLFSGYFDAFIQPVTKNVLWISGDQMHSIRSTDGGKTWFTMPSDNLLKLKTVSFADINNGFAIGRYNGSGDKIYKTTDGGLNWVEMATAPQSYMNFLSFFSPKNGYLSCGINLYKTTDGGEKWNLCKLDSSYKDFSVDNSHFLSDSLGFFMGCIVKNNDSLCTNIIFKTTDAGNHWFKAEKSITFVSFFDKKNGYACGYRNTVYKTTDSGENWINLDCPFSTNFRAISALGKEKAIMIGEGINGKLETLIKSTDSGKTWLDLDAGQLYYFNTLKFLTPKLGWGAGAEGKIFKTTDGGDNWIQQRNSDANQAIDYGYFLDELNGWYLCRDNRVTGYIILQTTNGGTKWDSLFTIPYSLYSIHFVNKKTGYVCGTGGRIFKTTTGGKTWKLYATTETNQSLTSIYFLDELHGWSVGDRASIIKTTDGGETWFRSGGSWGRYYDIYFADSLHGWLGGIIDYSNVPVLRTSDGGVNWQHIFFSEDTWFDKIYFPTLKTGYGLTNYGFLYKTNDSGYTWRMFNMQGSGGINAVSFADEFNGWAATINGLILKTTNGGEDSPIVFTGNDRKKEYDFSLGQNFPNPFNPVTNIRYSLSKEGRIKIVLYDLLGQAVKTILDEEKPAGEYNAILNLSDYSSGVYFYSLFAGENVITKKLLFLK